MKKLSNKELKTFKGAGWILSLAVAIVSAIVVFTLSNNFAAAISAAIPIGVAIGIGLEQRFQRKNELINPKKIKILINFLTIGFIVFVVLFFTSKYI